MNTEFTDEEINVIALAGRNTGPQREYIRAILNKAAELRPAPALKEGWRLLEEGEIIKNSDHFRHTGQDWKERIEMQGIAMSKDHVPHRRRCMVGPDITPIPEPTAEDVDRKEFEAAAIELGYRNLSKAGGNGGYFNIDVANAYTGWKAAKGIK